MNICLPVDASEAEPFNVNTASITKLREARALCINILEEHNMQRAWYLDVAGLRQVMMHKREIERAARERFNIRVWPV